MIKSETFPEKRPYNRFLRAVGISLALVACNTEAKTGDPTPSEAEFMSKVNVTVVAPGYAGSVPEVDGTYRDAFNDLNVVNQTNSYGNNRTNTLTPRPNRYKAGFNKGDGSGADSVCEDLKVVGNPKYVFAVQDSNNPAWIYFEPDAKTLHICYHASDNPDTVAAWSSNQSR